MNSKTIFEKSHPGRVGTMPPPSDCPAVQACEVIPAARLRGAKPELPELTELEVMRHFVGLSQKNYSVDTQFYPLGSCTMKYNPRVNELVASLPGFTDLHPLSGCQHVQGALQLMYELQKGLAEITGMEAVTLQPSAGAHGEVTALFAIERYFKAKGENRHIIIVPDSSHGTNPASAALAGFEVVTIPSSCVGKPLNNPNNFAFIIFLILQYHGDMPPSARGWRPGLLRWR